MYHGVGIAKKANVEHKLNIEPLCALKKVTCMLFENSTLVEV